MNALITLCLEQKNIIPLGEIPRELLSPSEIEIVDFIVEFYAKHKVVPPISRVQDEIDFFFPTRIKDAETYPIADALEQVKKAKLVHHWVHTLENCVGALREEGEEIPLDVVTELVKLTVSTSSMTSFSGFDRDEYFRGAGLQSGFRLIDVATGGVAPGEVMVVAGRLGHKKTTVALFVAHHWWEQGKKILLASNEMAPADVYSRLDGMVGRFNPLLLRHDGKADGKAKRLAADTREVVRIHSKEHGGEIFIPRARMRTPSQVFATAQYLGVDAVIIDGLYLMHPDGGSFGAKWERVSEISNQLKEAAMDSRLPVVAVTQTKRTGGRKDLYDPEDLAYSDSIGQDADFIVFVSPSVLDKNKLELQLVKNRFGKEISTLASIDFDKMTITEESVLSEEIVHEEFFGKKKDDAAGEWWGADKS